MTRRRIRSNAAMSLFPFLAVLICTMGSLIVLLVLLVQQARVQASVITKQEEDEQVKEERRKQQEVADEEQWRRSILEKQRQAKLQELNDERERLSNLEDHLRELKDEWRRVQQELQALKRTKSKKGDLELASQSQLAIIAKKIARAKQDVDNARKQLAGKRRSFAIVPYRGPNGTTQRPIYVECLDDVAIIRPEGIQIPLSYLDGPTGAGNPLEAALRAIRDYWKKNGIVDRATDPYPLIVVRPGGEWTYSRVRRAMTSWEDQFGYELIPKDMKLDYPPADARLAKLVENEIREAHRRQEIIKRMRPRSFSGTAGGRRGGGRSTAGGGFQFGGAGGNRGSGSSSSGGGRVAMGNGGGFGGPGLSELRAQARKRAQQKSKQAQKQGGPRGTRSANGARNAQSGGQPGGDRSSGSGSGMPTSLARSNGKNWAIPNYKPRAAAFVRHIRVGVGKDALKIFPDKGFGGRTKVFPIRGNPRSSIEEFVHSDIWDHVKTWGIAAAGGYWKPVLQAKVEPGGEQRFQQMKALLKDSGLELKRTK